MVGRYSGAILGLLAFAVTILAGLWARNPVDVTLTRALWALTIFCIIGLVVGAAAQYVINDYARRRHEELMKQVRGESDDGDEEVVETAQPATNSSTEPGSEPMGT